MSSLNTTKSASTTSSSILAVSASNQTEMDTLRIAIENDVFYQTMEAGEIKAVSISEMLVLLPGLDRIFSIDEDVQYINVPLRSQDELVGVLTLGTLMSQVYEDSQLDIIRELANSLALAIHHSSLHQELADYVGELAQRNDDLDAFAHTVAHDLKSPISVIAGYSGVLSEDIQTAPRDDLEQYVNVIIRTADKMNDIVNELLLLAEIRKQDVRNDQLEMSDIVEKALSRLHYSITSMGAEVFTPNNWPVTSGYGPWIEEVWVNYLNNALKYGGHPPKIWLGADKYEDAQTNDIYIRFWIQDNGDGITPEEQALLFAPFTRMDQVRVKGHGLGLSIVHRIIDKLGGKVGVESDGLAGHGCIFYFTLPAVGGRGQSGFDDNENK